ncbi:hypothetical protein ACH3XW_45800 [Acanthocheilonema viteae]
MFLKTHFVVRFYLLLAHHLMLNQSGENEIQSELTAMSDEYARSDIDNIGHKCVLGWPDIGLNEYSQ